jgi:HK97 family phage major capsid protein
LKETVRTHAAAEVLPGAVKPTSVYSVVKVEDRVRVIATLSEPVSRMDLADATLLQAYLEGSLQQSVMLRLDSEILNGDGAGENLTGLAHTSGITVQAFATDLLHTARKALTQLEDVQIPGGVYVLSPAMWESLELTQTTGSGEFIFGSSPVDRAAKRLWGMPVVVTTALSGANAYVFDPGSVQLWERETVKIDWSEAPAGSVAGKAAFETNEIKFRAEGRWGFAVTRPDGVVQFATA